MIPSLYRQPFPRCVVNPIIFMWSPPPSFCGQRHPRYDVTPPLDMRSTPPSLCGQPYPRYMVNDTLVMRSTSPLLCGQPHPRYVVNLILVMWSTLIPQPTTLNARPYTLNPVRASPTVGVSSSSSLLLSSLELSDATIHEPYIRALLGTASHFSEVVVLKCWVMWCRGLGSGVKVKGLGCGSRGVVLGKGRWQRVVSEQSIGNFRWRGIYEL